MSHCSGGPGAWSPPQVRLASTQGGNLALASGATGRRQLPPQLSRHPCPCRHPAAVYYMLRERQLAYQLKAAAFQSARCWRQQSVAAELDSELLRRRGCPQLPPVRLPLTAAGVGVREKAVCVGSFSVTCLGPEGEPSSKRSRLSAVDQQQLEQRRRHQLAAAVVAAAVEEALHLVAPHPSAHPLPATPPLAARLSCAPAHDPRLAGPPGCPPASWLERVGSLLSPAAALRSVVVR